MYTKKIGERVYQYDKEQLNLLVGSKIKQDFDKFCKEKRLKKNKLVEDFMKAVLLNARDSSFNASKTYCTVRIL